MKDEEIYIKEKLQSQIEHIFRFYENNELEDKMYDLAYEWYVKGFYAGIKHNKK